MLDVIHSVKSVDKLSKVINDLSHLINDLFTNCQKVMIDRYPIHITHRSLKKSIQSDNYWSIYSVGQVLLTERTHRQTDKQTATLILIYNKKIYIFTINDSFYFLGEDVHTHSTNKQKQNIEPPPIAPRRQFTYTQTIRTNAQTGVSIFHVSIF